MLIANIILTITWVLLTGEITLTNLAIGFILGYLLLTLVSRSTASERLSSYVARWPRLLRFVGYFVGSIIMANVRMTIAIFSPLHRLNPAIVAIPLDVQSSAEITLLANWITLTPGTLSLEVSADRSTLFVHTFDGGADIEAFRQEIKTKFEKRVQEVFQ